MKQFDIAVIGAGFGGLSSALSLQSMGLNVVLIEALDKVGGRAYVEVHNGYHFDRGPSIITAPFLIDEIFEMSGAQRSDYCDFVSVDPFYKVVFHDDTFISHYNAMDQLLAEIKKIEPSEINGVIAFFNQAEKIFHKGFLELGDKNFANPLSMVGVAPHLLKLDAIRPIYSMVSRYVKNEKIRQFLSFHPLLIGGNPFRASAVYSLINRLERAYGVFHTIGGMHKLATAFEKRFLELGGQLYLSSPVEFIDKNSSGTFQIRTNNFEFKTPRVIVNGDLCYFVNGILKNSAKPLRLARKLKKADYSMSAFLIFLGTKKQWHHMPQHTIALSARYKELLDDIFIHKNEFDDFSLYIHMPTRTDASLAPEGCEVIYALVPVPNLSSGTDWHMYKEKFSKQVKNHLEERFLPGLTNSIVEERIFTPLDFEVTLRSHLGNAFGLEPWILQSAGFRPSNRCTEVDGLYFVGANTQPGAGLPGVLLSARITTRLIAEDLGHSKTPVEVAKIPKAYSFLNEL